MSSQYPRTCEEMRKIGVDPGTVALDDFTTAGYYQFKFRDGQKIINGEGHAERTLREWPDPATALRVVSLFVREKEGLE